MVTTSFFVPNTFVITFPVLLTLLVSKCAYKFAVFSFNSSKKDFTIGSNGKDLLRFAFYFISYNQFPI